MLGKHIKTKKIKKAIKSRYARNIRNALRTKKQLGGGYMSPGEQEVALKTILATNKAIKTGAELLTPIVAAGTNASRTVQNQTVKVGTSLANIAQAIRRRVNSFNPNKLAMTGLQMAFARKPSPKQSSASTSSFPIKPRQPSFKGTKASAKMGARLP